MTTYPATTNMVRTLMIGLIIVVADRGACEAQDSPRTVGRACEVTNGPFCASLRVSEEEVHLFYEATGEVRRLGSNPMALQKYAPSSGAIYLQGQLPPGRVAAIAAYFPSAHSTSLRHRLLVIDLALSKVLHQQELDWEISKFECGDLLGEGIPMVVVEAGSTGQRSTNVHAWTLSKTNQVKEVLSEHNSSLVSIIKKSRDNAASGVVLQDLSREDTDNQTFVKWEVPREGFARWMRP